MGKKLWPIQNKLRNFGRFFNNFGLKVRESLYVGIGGGDHHVAGGEEEDVSEASKLSVGARILKGP